MPHPTPGAGVSGGDMKVQKKYYLEEGLARRVAVAAARSGFRQSAIVEACLTLHLVKDACRAKGKGRS